MKAITIFVLILFALNALVSLTWLAKDVIPQPQPRTRRMVIVQLLIALVMVALAALALLLP